MDLAAKEKNPTGICILQKNEISVKTVFSNNEILDTIDFVNPTVVAIDAPLIKDTIKIRKADRLMKKYGAMPPTMPSMTMLTQRGSRLAQRLRIQQYTVIEVFPTGSAKILGFYHTKYKKSVEQLNMHNVFNNKHEYDAYICSLTAKLYHLGKTKQVGDEQGVIVIPKSLQE
ncbi:MAG: DUF429 domain-containing protein [Candidatus Thermoplasmatota archaeon]|nr:DUF429 domain-containing protein [Candidatus Thermoplasmatota archaeon]